MQDSNYAYNAACCFKQIFAFSYTCSSRIYTDAMNNRHRKTFLEKYLPLTLFVTFERVTQGLRVRGSWRPNRSEIFWPPTLMAVNVVSFSFSWCSTGGPGVHSAGCWLSVLHLISNFSGPQIPSGFPRAPSAGCGFPYHIYNSVSNGNWNCHLTSVLTELYNSSTSTRSPTRSLKSYV